MFPPTQPWNPKLHWESPAGQMLDRVIAALPDNRAWEITVFGSAPLQLGLDPAFLSGDVDIIPTTDSETVADCLSKVGLLKDQVEYYVEVVPAHVFNAPADWRERAYREQRKHVLFVFPHPVDILVAKVCRTAEKDLLAFRLVRDLTGHPTPEELIVGLRKVVDIYRPTFDEEHGRNALANTKLLWQEIFGAEIDVQREIIRPALEERRRYLNQGAGLKDKLREIGERGRVG